MYQIPLKIGAWSIDYYVNDRIFLTHSGINLILKLYTNQGSGFTFPRWKLLQH